jgi:hemolysin activation/secretion protein
MRLTPYGFYDMGRVWNENAGIDRDMSGASVGAGVRLISDFGVSGDAGFAFPLWRDVATPIGQNGQSPRYLMQLSYGF